MSGNASPTSTGTPRGHAPLTTQVGGHAGVTTSEDGSLIIKPALPVEISFYESVGSIEEFSPLRPFIPKFYGTLKLEGQVDPKAIMAASGEGAMNWTHLRPAKDDRRDKDKWPLLCRCLQSIVLENLTRRFSKPCIFDIKLGTILYDKFATPEKKERMEKTARETTSYGTGLRVTGFQIQDLAAGVPINTVRQYGKSLKKEDLPSTFARFFPISTLLEHPKPPSEPATAPPPANPQPGSGVIPRDGTGLPPKTLLPILEGTLKDVQAIRDAIAQVEMQMVGGSLLLVYEADWERAAEGVRKEADGEFLDDGVDEDGEDEDSDEEKDKVGPAHLVKLIDFAHTFIQPGDGPDQGVLKGMDTTLELLKGRIVEVKAALSA